MERARRNLVLLTIDAWRADFVDEHAGVPLTPSLSSLASRTVRFDNAYAGGPWTSPALVSIFTGQSAARHGVHFEWSSPRPAADRPPLAALLRQAGFTVPNLCYLNRLENYANLGYDAASAPDYPHGPADDLLTPSLRALRGEGEPFFLWFHYKFVHLPYWASAPFRARLGIDEGAIPQRLRDSVCKGFVVPRDAHRLAPEDRELVRRLYAAGVLEMDAWLGRVLEALREGGLDERTTLVVTSDHGEELLDHGHVGHASTAHHATLHEEVLRIPLLIVDARLEGRGRRLQARVHGMDLYQTLLRLAGVAAPQTEGGTHGGADLTPLLFEEGPEAEGLAAALDGRAFYFHSARMGCPTPRALATQSIEALSDGHHKLVSERYDVPRLLLYDLERDPREEFPSQRSGEGLPDSLVDALEGS